MPKSPDNIQNFNRYSYVMNNPLNYTDPSGNSFEDLKTAFGNFFGNLYSSSGGSNYYTEAQVQAQANLSAELAFVYAQQTAKVQVSIASAFIGAGVGGFVASGSFAGASALGSIVGGATSGAFSASANAYIDGGNVGDAAWKGAVSGAAGSFVSGAVGGMAGAVFGGAVGSGLSAGLNGGTPSQIITNALIGGATSAAFYELQMAMNYKSGSNGLNYGAYRKVQATIGRSNFWETEAAWYEMNDGSVSGIHYGKMFKNEVQVYDTPVGAKYESHTHVRIGIGNQYQGPGDIRAFKTDPSPGVVGYKTYGWNTMYTISSERVNSLPMPDYYLKTSFGNESYNTNYAYKNGINSGGITHNYFLFSVLFRYGY